MHIQRITTAAVSLGRGPIARGSLTSMAIRIASLVLGFLQAVFTARLLGPEGYGVVAVALSIVTIVSILAMLGFGPLAIREVAQRLVRADWARLRGFLKFSGLSVTGASILAGGVIASLALNSEVFEARFRHEIAIASILVLPLAMLFYLRGVLQGFGHVLAAHLPGDLLRPVIMIGCLGVLLVLGRPMTTEGFIILAVAAAGIATLLATLILRWTVRLRIPAVTPKVEPRSWSRSAAPFLAILVLSAVSTETSTLLLGWLSGPAQAGLFQPIARLTAIMLIANEALAMPLLPRVAALWEKGDVDGVQNLYRLATLFATLGTIAVVVSVTFVAPLILSAFGDEFLANKHLLVWIGLAQIVNASAGNAAQMLSMANAMCPRIIAQVVACIVQIGLGLILIGPFGAEGATAALIGSILVWSILHWLLTKLVLNIDTSLLAYWRQVRFVRLRPD